MKKLFTLIAMTVMAIGANAQSDPALYTFDNQASTYVLGDNCAASTYTMDKILGFSVNYTSEVSEKMQVKVAANEEIFFEYKNSSTKTNVMKTGENYVQFDSKNFIIHIPVKNGDKIQIKFSAKGSAPTVGIDGSEPPVTMDEGAATTCSGKTEADAVIFSCTATKGGTAKIKESANGMRLYAISINQDVAGINNVKTTNANDAAVFNLAGQKVGNGYKGIAIQNGKKVVNK